MEVQHLATYRGKPIKSVEKTNISSFPLIFWLLG